MERSLPTPDTFALAQKHLARRDPVLRRLIKGVGPCTLRFEPDGFGTLARAIVSQMISTKAARSVGARLEALLGDDGLTPAALLAAPEETVRAAGLSRAKVQALRDLAARVEAGTLDLAALPGLPDEEVVAQLLPVRGIGVWTVNMYLIFSLGRLDVLPVADLGLRAGVMEQYGLEGMPSPRDLAARAEPWRPYRTVATWYFWKSRGWVPQSDENQKPETRN